MYSWLFVMIYYYYYYDRGNAFSCVSLCVRLSVCLSVMLELLKALTQKVHIGMQVNLQNI